MSVFDRRTPRTALLATITTLALSTALVNSPAAQAGDRDRDGDGMPNRWEVSNGLNPDRANGRADRDDDGLSNRGEFRHGADPADEDSDHDGDDDGDEVHDGVRGTHVDDRDSDDDGTRDGDEDADHDGVDNEDEDDASEACEADDDDRDADHISDEDENDFGFRAGDADSDDDEVLDGDEDSDDDGQVNEDDDDSDEDSCADDSEDGDDVLGPIVSFDAETGDLVINTVRSGQLTFVVTDDTEIELDSSGHGSGGDASTEDLVEGAVVAEVDLEDADDVSEKLQGQRVLEEIELARP